MRGQWAGVHGPEEARAHGASRSVGWVGPLSRSDGPIGLYRAMNNTAIYIHMAAIF
jgi:hypothetical protein